MIRLLYLGQMDLKMGKHDKGRKMKKKKEENDSKRSKVKEFSRTSFGFVRLIDWSAPLVAADWSHLFKGSSGLKVSVKSNYVRASSVADQSSRSILM